VLQDWYWINAILDLHLKSVLMLGKRWYEETAKTVFDAILLTNIYKGTNCWLYSSVLSGWLTCPFDFCAVGIFYYIFRRVGWQEPGKLYGSIIQVLRFAKNMLMSETDNVFPVLMNLLSDCYYWLGCWWKPIWRCDRWNHVRIASFIDQYPLFKLFILCP